MDEIALFPLNIFLLPGDMTQLYIFEDRYKQLIADAQAGDGTFGIPFTNKMNGSNLGTKVKLVEVVKTYPDGEMDVVIQAEGVFKLEQFFYQFDDRLYPGGRVQHWPAMEAMEADYLLRQRLQNYLIKHNSYNSELLIKEKLDLFEVANAVQMSDLEKLEWLKLKEPGAMRSFLFNYLRYLELLQEQESHVYQNLYLN